MWIDWHGLGTEFGWSGRAVHTPNHRAIFLTLQDWFLFIFQRFILYVYMNMCSVYVQVVTLACAQKPGEGQIVWELELQAFAGCLACSMGAEIWTLIFMIVQQALLTTEPSLQPRAGFLWASRELLRETVLVIPKCCLWTAACCKYSLELSFRTCIT